MERGPAGNLSSSLVKRGRGPEIAQRWCGRHFFGKIRGPRGRSTGWGRERSQGWFQISGWSGAIQKTASGKRSRHEGGAEKKVLFGSFWTVLTWPLGHPKAWLHIRCLKIVISSQASCMNICSPFPWSSGFLISNKIRRHICTIGRVCSPEPHTEERRTLWRSFVFCKRHF